MARILRQIYEASTFDRLALVLVFSVITIAAALSPMQPDTWWHLRAGADMVQSHHVLRIDTYSHTAFGMPWPNHEWLSQVVLYGVYAVGGLPLLSLFAAAVIVSAWAVVWRLCAGSNISTFMLVAVALVPASLHWSPRPHVFSLLFLMATVALIVVERLKWLPLVFLVWANCHGAVVLGLLVLGVGFAVAIGDKPREWRRYGIIFAACLVATTLTPLGVSFWTEIPKSLARIQQYPIDEWRSPSISELPLAPLWIAAALLCGSIAYRWRTLLRPIDRPTRVLCGCTFAFLPLAMMSVRNVGPFLMLAAPTLTRLFALTESDAEDRSRPQRQEHPLINLCAMTFIPLLVILTLSSAYRLQIPHLRWSPLPNASLQALDRCPDNLYNRYDEGGYLVWFAPRHRVFLDGRQDPYPPAVIRDQLKAEHSGEYASTFAQYGIRCAYLPTSSPVARRLASAGWATLYRDRQWVVLAN